MNLNTLEVRNIVMTKFKKLSSRILISAFALMMLTGCGKKKDEKTTAEATTAATTAVVTEATTEVATVASTTEAAKASKNDAEGKVADKSEMTEVEEVIDNNMTPIKADALNDGEYDINALSSSSMFKIEGAKLVVADGKLTVTMVMGGKGYLYIYPGTPEEAAAANESDYISFEENEDGKHTFTFEIDALDSEVKCAAYSKKKEKWYDRSLCFTAGNLPVSAFKEGTINTAEKLGLADGEYTAEVSFAGGSGKAKVDSPVKLKVENGVVTATLVWSSSNYDYMIVDGEKIDTEIVDDRSTFVIPVAAFDHRIAVKADTTAMSKPYEIDYSLKFDSSSIEEVK